MGTPAVYYSWRVSLSRDYPVYSSLPIGFRLSREKKKKITTGQSVYSTAQVYYTIYICYKPSALTVVPLEVEQGKE